MIGQAVLPADVSVSLFTYTDPHPHTHTRTQLSFLRSGQLCSLRDKRTGRTPGCQVGMKLVVPRVSNRALKLRKNIKPPKGASSDPPACLSRQDPRGACPHNWYRLARHPVPTKLTLNQPSPPPPQPYMQACTSGHMHLQLVVNPSACQPNKLFLFTAHPTDFEAIASSPMLAILFDKTEYLIKTVISNRHFHVIAPVRLFPLLAVVTTTNASSTFIPSQPASAGSCQFRWFIRRRYFHLPSGHRGLFGLGSPDPGTEGHFSRPASRTAPPSPPSASSLRPLPLAFEVGTIRSADPLNMPRLNSKPVADASAVQMKCLTLTCAAKVYAHPGLSW
ncbi:unnamed protein product [Protopolystoma xenopodis]|uniref:Uncharacterized protein n=1 Tax=Protopolystoma xenopodis TaxID=117903 RepID=A0A448XET1_9PLAT|nr:unnamed protein product [Protopolystoma xenopodis]